MGSAENTAAFKAVFVELVDDEFNDQVELDLWVIRVEEWLLDCLTEFFCVSHQNLLPLSISIANLDLLRLKPFLELFIQLFIGDIRLHLKFSRYLTIHILTRYHDLLIQQKRW